MPVAHHWAGALRTRCTQGTLVHRLAAVCSAAAAACQCTMSRRRRSSPRAPFAAAPKAVHSQAGTTTAGVPDSVGLAEARQMRCESGGPRARWTRTTQNPRRSKPGLVIQNKIKQTYQNKQNDFLLFVRLGIHCLVFVFFNCCANVKFH